VVSTDSLHKIEEEESPQEKAAREKFEAGQALLNSSRGDKIQVNMYTRLFSVLWIWFRAAWPPGSGSKWAKRAAKKRIKAKKLDVLFCGLEVSPLACTSLMEALGNMCCNFCFNEFFQQNYSIYGRRIPRSGSGSVMLDPDLDLH
jgi:hypothetical protein